MTFRIPHPLALAIPMVLLGSGAAQAFQPVNEYASHGVRVCNGNRCTGGDLQTAGNMATNSKNYSEWAAASLADGKLHALADTTNDPDLPSYCTVLTCNWWGSAEAEVWDTIELSTKNHAAGEVVNYSFSMDGTKTRGKWAWGNGTYATARYYLGTSKSGFSGPLGVDLGRNNIVNGSFTVPADGVLTLYYLADIYVYAESGSVADYSNTMRFDWDLPDDVQVTSASGVFLAGTVPEPGNAALVAAGFGLLAWLARRRQGRHASA